MNHMEMNTLRFYLIYSYSIIWNYLNQIVESIHFISLRYLEKFIKLNKIFKNLFEYFSKYNLEMELKVRVVEADDIPKTDTLSKSDPYVVLTLSSSSETWKTEVKKNTLKPVWDQEFTIPIHPKLDEILKVEIYDKDVGKDQLISRVLLQVNKIPEGKADSSWYTMHAAKGMKKGGKLMLVIEKKV